MKKPGNTLLPDRHTTKTKGGTNRPVIFHSELSDWFKNGTRIKFGAKKISPSGFRQILLFTDL